MSSTVTRLPLEQAEALAGRFVAMLVGTFDRVEIAGSVRRRSPTVGDVEIVMVPTISERVERDLFGDVRRTVGVDLLAARLETLADNETVRPRTFAEERVVWGQRTRYMTFEGHPIDLFTVDHDRFGWILALRTGPATFSRQLVRPTHDDAGRPLLTSDGRRGLMPTTLRSRGGWLTWRTSGERIATPNERDVFDLFGLPYVEPHERF
jgi:DNA polymerase/3'-5' exonuclease PolX